MKKFVVGFLSFFDNDLQLEIIHAEDEVKALKQSKFIGDYEFPENATMDDIQDIMLNCDSVVSVIEV